MSTIVLDMDLTLINSEHNVGHTTADPNIKYEMRPHLREFLEGVNELFDNVIIWSAGTHRYVNTIIDDVYSRLRIPRPTAVFAREFCRYMSNGFVKPLIDLKQFIDIDLAKTFFVDDTLSTFSMNVTNALHITRYNGGAYDTGALRDMLAWFKTVIDEDDYRLVFKPKF